MGNKTFTQNWYPIHAIGTPIAANTEAGPECNTEAELCESVFASRLLSKTRPSFSRSAVLKLRWKRNIKLRTRQSVRLRIRPVTDQTDIAVSLYAGTRILIEYDSRQIPPASPSVIAKEPKAPEEIESIEELYLTGYISSNIATRLECPKPYWTEGLRRDPCDSRIRNAMGLWHLRRGDFERQLNIFRPRSPD